MLTKSNSFGDARKADHGRYTMCDDLDLDKRYYLWNHLHVGRLFWFGRYHKISVWAVSDVVSVSILECHRIQAIIASSLKYFCHHHQLWNAGCWLGSQNLFVVRSDLDHRPISSPPVVDVSGLTIETVTSLSGTTISSLGTPRKVCVPRPCDTVH